jgi:hypothetical protein
MADFEHRVTRLCWKIASLGLVDVHHKPDKDDHFHRCHPDVALYNRADLDELEREIPAMRAALAEWEASR